MHDIVATLTTEEILLLQGEFDEYSSSGIIDDLNVYKKLLADKYGFSWDRVTINAKGEVRQMQSTA